MGSLTNYSENKLLDHICGTAYTAAATVYVGLSEADPTDDGSGWSEADYTGYAREAITFGAAASRVVTQSGAITFDECTGGTNTITHWGIWDALTNGNLLAHGALGSSTGVSSGSTPSIASGEINVTFSTGGLSTAAANSLLDLMFRNQAYSAPANYVGLVTSTSSDSAAGTEVSGGSYAREIVNVAGGASPAWSAASGGAVANGADIEFTDPTGSWGTVVGVIIMDAATNGNFLMYDNSTADTAITSGDTVTIASGDLDITLS